MLDLGLAETVSGHRMTTHPCRAPVRGGIDITLRMNPTLTNEWTTVHMKLTTAIYRMHLNRQVQIHDATLRAVQSLARKTATRVITTSMMYSAHSMLWMYEMTAIHPNRPTSRQGSVTRLLLVSSQICRHRYPEIWTAMNAIPFPTSCLDLLWITEAASANRVGIAAVNCLMDIMTICTLRSRIIISSNNSHTNDAHPRPITSSNRHNHSNSKIVHSVRTVLPLQYHSPH
ncbi:hypothetical protein DFS34DRAFT_133318 [Phlyctochytrium arcticum]|nr:hypothetical protein DFS34DRAFT_133318 [Phlyctochytrium arcticum]